MAHLPLWAAGLLQALLLGSVAGTQLDLHQRSTIRSSDGHETESLGPMILDKEEYPEQSLRICNAYANPAALEVYNLGTGQRLTEGGPLAYKACGDFRLTLREGDQLDFRANNISVGIFRAMGLPKTKASLLLVPHRRTQNSISAAFESHAFTDLDSSQIVIVDAFAGQAAGSVKLLDAVEQSTPGDRDQKTASHPQRQADLRFSSVVSVKPGQYQVLLQDASNKSVATLPLMVAKGGGKYVVIRTGNEPETNQTFAAFPQDLVVYPPNDAWTAARLHLFVVTAVAFFAWGAAS